LLFVPKRIADFWRFFFIRRVYVTLQHFPTNFNWFFNNYILSNLSIHSLYWFSNSFTILVIITSFCFTISSFSNPFLFLNHFLFLIFPTNSFYCASLLCLLIHMIYYFRWSFIWSSYLFDIIATATLVEKRKFGHKVIRPTFGKN
jgi:hypothetical protein